MLVEGSSSVFVPLPLAQLRVLATEGSLAGPLPAYGVTPELAAWGEFGPDELEDATFAAQTLAGVAAVTWPEAEKAERRVVLAVPATGFAPAADGIPGEGTVPQLEWRGVQAVFSDDPSVDLAAVRDLARGRTVAEAWDDVAVAEFAEENDLGWFTPDEARHW